MSTVKDFFSFLVEKFPEERINVRWSGGEPLLIGFDFFNSAVEWQKKISQNFENEISTNLTLLNEEYIRFFKENNFAIYTSLDGIGHSHDFQRDGSFNLVRRALIDLKEAGINSIFVNSVITKQNCTIIEEIYNFCQSYDFNWNFTMVVPSGVQKAQAEKLIVSPIDFSNRIIKIFDKWFLSETPLKIPIFHYIIRYIMRREDYIRMDEPQISIGPDATLYACRRLVGNPLHSLGKFVEQSPLERPKCRTCSYQMKNFRQCENCYFDFLCNLNYCAYLHKVYASFPDLSHYLCNCLKPIYTHILECVNSEILINLKYQHEEVSTNERREESNFSR